MTKKKNPKDFILKKSDEVKGAPIRGYDFDEGVDYHKIISSFGSTGFQASNFARGVEIVNKMISEKAFTFLGYTSNMVSSGLRDIFRYLVKHKKVNVVVTSGGGIEEDIIKCLGDFVLGEFTLSGSELRERGVNRIGNVLAPNNRYIDFESFMQPFLEEIWQEQEKTGFIISPSELIWKLGEKINDERSICYWAWKNKIKIYCPAITDGSLGDNIYFFRTRRPKFELDMVRDAQELNDTTVGLEKSGVIILGSGVIKHAILNANLYRNGADYAVYINTAQEFDGSDAGALPEEAVAWGKLLPKCERVKIHGDATILFPLLVAETFAKKIRRE